MNWYKANNYCKNNNSRLPLYEELKNLWLDSYMSSYIKGFELSLSYRINKVVKGNPRVAVLFYFSEEKEG